VVDLKLVCAISTLLHTPLRAIESLGYLPSVRGNVQSATPGPAICMAGDPWRSTGRQCRLLISILDALLELQLVQQTHPAKFAIAVRLSSCHVVVGAPLLNLKKHCICHHIFMARGRRSPCHVSRGLVTRGGQWTRYCMTSQAIRSTLSLPRLDQQLTGGPPECNSTLWLLLT